MTFKKNKFKIKENVTTNEVDEDQGVYVDDIIEEKEYEGHFTQEEQSDSGKMNAVRRIAAYFRQNPHRLVKEYLGIDLRLFQKILLYEMFNNNYFMYIASRGQGKSFLCAIYVCVLCILYPGIKVIVTAKRKGQAIEVIQKIEGLRKQSTNLNLEIEKLKTGVNDAQVVFKNGSTLIAATGNDDSRHFRANLIVIDEFVKMDKKILDTVFKKFLTALREPPYMRKPQYKDREDLREPNREMYLSSAWIKSHWSWELLKTYFINMIDGKKYFCCDLPYQLSIKEKLLEKTQIENEMSESTFDAINFDIEMCGRWLGGNSGSFFKYDDLSKRQILSECLPTYDLIKYDSNILKTIKDPGANCRRILSVDIALMASKSNENDASSLIINDAIPNSSNVFMANIKLVKSLEGLITEELGITIMRYFYLYKCTDLVIDARSLGIPLVDFLGKDQYDKETNMIYQALKCCNNVDYAERCRTVNAKECLWCIVASSSFNTQMNVQLRAGFQNGNINLLVNRYDCDDYIKENVKGFKSLDPEKQYLYQEPYYETDLLVHELIGLVHEQKGQEIKLSEVSGARKDRYSSLGYNYSVMKQIEQGLKIIDDEDDLTSFFTFRQPVYK